MAPPFLTHYAPDTGNTRLLPESAEQCKRYRELLQMPTGLWQSDGMDRDNRR